MKHLAPLLILAVMASTPALACTFKPDDPTSCVRFVGCVNAGEAHFFGFARGWDAGPLTGSTSSGATCTGDWTYDERLNRGKGSIACSDGNKAGFSFFSRDGQVQTHTGVTISDKGDRMSLWTGGGLIDYFAAKHPDQSQAGFQCGENWVPFPKAFLPPTQD